jgi:hypothetical protein
MVNSATPNHDVLLISNACVMGNMHDDVEPHATLLIVSPIRLVAPPRSVIHLLLYHVIP